MDQIKSKGFIQGKIKYKDGTTEVIRFNNHVLNGGREFLAKCLLNDSPKLHIANMLFGDGGTVNGEPKEVSPTQDKINGVIRVKKSVIAQIDPEFPTQVIFSVVVGEEEGNDFTLNEMGLELSNETLFSLSTFGDYNKTNQMEIVWSWVVQFI